jgi:hypothetical protein
MYLRTTQRRNKDGSVVRYVQLAHNRRVEGVTQAEVLLNLGRDETAGALSSEGSGGQVTMTAGGPSGGWSGPRKGVIPAAACAEAPCPCRLPWSPAMQCAGARSRRSAR